MKRALFVIGPESSGSMLAAKICAHVLGVASYGKWTGARFVEKRNVRVFHRSIPYETKIIFPNIDEWMNQHKDYNKRFVITVRDTTLSEISRIKRFSATKESKTPYNMELARAESDKAKDILIEVMDKYPYFLFSYEVFLYLGLRYLKDLYKFLGVNSDFYPSINNANLKRIKEAHTIVGL